MSFQNITNKHGDLRIVLTGGGTAGHVIPHLAILPVLKKNFAEIHYIGSHEGIEKKIIAEQAAGVTYHSVTTAKLRRSFDLRNLAIPFKLCSGVRQASKILKQIKPDAVFSKGGFVAYPVVRAAAKLKIPVVAHESDMTMGLANKMSAKFCKVICTTFAKTAQGKENMIHTGSPLRDRIFNGISIKVERRHLFKTDTGRGNLLIIGGSLGATKINQAVRAVLDKLDFNIVHICGKGKVDESIKIDGYVQLEFVNDIEHYFAWADIVISRAGSNALCELLALKKPTLFIPLSKAQSRGDQLENAAEVKAIKAAEVLFEESLCEQTLIDAIAKLYKNRDVYAKNASKMGELNGTDKIAEIIVRYSR